MLQSRGRWPQVHHLPHDNTSSSSCSLSSCLLDPLLFPSAFHLLLSPSCFCILPISFFGFLSSASFLFFPLVSLPSLSSCLLFFYIIFSPSPLFCHLLHFPFLLFFLLCSSPLNISSSYYLSSPLSSSYFFLFPSHLLLYSSPHFFFLFPSPR